MIPNSSLGRPLVFIVGLLLATVYTETIDPVPTLNGDNHDMSGGGTYDVVTKDPFQDKTEQAFTYEYEDTTNSPPVEDEGVLGPGAITAIVIAVFLGASVLLALIVITLRKFTAS